MKPTQLDPLEGANLNHWTSKVKSKKMERTYSVGSLRWS
jgi:hypothetical protein